MPCSPPERRFCFSTNNSAPTAEDLAVKLKHLGIRELNPRHFYTSAFEHGGFFERNASELHGVCDRRERAWRRRCTRRKSRTMPSVPTTSWWVKARQQPTSSPRPMNTSTRRAAGCHQSGQLVPFRRTKTRPGAGATAAFLEASTGRRAYYLGNPTPTCFTVREKSSARVCTVSSADVMIGDTMATDIRGAIEIGLHAFLVMTGSTRLEEVGDYVYQPTRVLQSIADLVDEVRLGQVSDRTEQSCFGVSPIARAKPGSRHQTDIYALYRPRPRPAMTK